MYPDYVDECADVFALVTNDFPTLTDGEISDFCSSACVTDLNVSVCHILSHHCRLSVLVL